MAVCNFGLLFRFTTVSGCGVTEIHLYRSVKQTLLSPLYPHDYPSNIACTWQVRTANGPSGRPSILVVAIVDFLTEDGTDLVTLKGPGLVLGDTPSGLTADQLTLSGTTSVTTVTSLDGQLIITFSSDLFYGGRFQMDFMAVSGESSLSFSY